MKKLGHLLFAIVAVALLSTATFAQRGPGGPNGGPDTTVKHVLDSIIHLHHDSLPPNPHDSIDNDGDGDHGKDTTVHHDTLPPPPPHKGWGRDSSHHGGFGGGNHSRIDISRLLRSDSCLMDLEALMTPADVATLNAAMAAIKNDQTQLQALEQQLQAQLKALRGVKPLDTAALHAALNNFRQQSQPLFQDLQNQTKTISTLLAGYQTQIQTVWSECTHPAPQHHRGTSTNGDSTLQLMASPVFPNPVSLSQGPAQTTLMYNLSQPAQVMITLSDAKGNTLQNLANDQEIAGPHTLVIPLAGLQTGVYYLRIQAGTIVQTQKIVVMN